MGSPALRTQDLKNKTVYAIALATTGLHPEEDDILGMCLVDVRTNQTVFESLIRPCRKKDWSQAAKINGLLPETVAAAPTMQDVLPIFRELETSCDCLTGYGLDFILAFLTRITPLHDGLMLVDLQRDFSCGGALQSRAAFFRFLGYRPEGSQLLGTARGIRAGFVKLLKSGQLTWWKYVPGTKTCFHVPDGSSQARPDGSGLRMKAVNAMSKQEMYLWLSAHLKSLHISLQREHERHEAGAGLIRLQAVLVREEPPKDDGEEASSFTACGQTDAQACRQLGTRLEAFADDSGSRECAAGAALLLAFADAMEGQHKDRKAGLPDPCACTKEEAD